MGRDKNTARAANACARFQPALRFQPSPPPTELPVLSLVATVLLGISPGSERPPNIVFFLADDLGWSEVGCYGQTRIRTPHIDRLAAEGMRFTQAYSGSPVCASSRCVLMTGLHTGHALIRGNKEVGGWGPDEPEGQWPLPDETVTLAELLKDQGYTTGAVGKWGLGGPGSSGHPCFQGFDFFYGLLCQRVAHNYYPTHLWHNHDVDVLDGNRWFKSHQRLKAVPEDDSVWDQYATARYAPDAMIEKTLDWLQENKDRPFFLYYPTPVPHVSLQVPEDSLAEYDSAFEETPYLGTQGYLPHPRPRAAYAAMVTRMDAHFGRILDLLDRLDLTGDTLVMFSSDNGPTFNGGTDSTFFESAGPFRGLKCSVLEGGIRVPMIARWPGKIAAGTVSEHPCAFEDVMPTLMDVSGGETPTGLDGLSFAPTLLGAGVQARRDHLYWEYPGLGGQQAVRVGQWKLVRENLRKGEVKTTLFDLEADPGESRDLSVSRPEVLKRMLETARRARTRSELFPMGALDREG